MQVHSSRLVLLASFAAFVLLACGDDPTVLQPGADAGGDPGTGDAANNEVTIQAISAIEAQVGDTTTVQVTAVNPDGRTLTWSVSSETLSSAASAAVTPTESGASFAFDASAADIGEHTVVVTATWDGGSVSAEFAVTVIEQPCYYPGPNGFARDLSFPDFAWTAQYADATQFDFDLYEFYCDDEAWGDYDTLLFVILTDWCPNCPSYIRYVDAFSERLESEGMLIFYLDVQDRSGRRTYTQSSNQHINQFTPNGSGIRAGDGDNLVRADGVVTSGLVEYFPTSFVVRRSDMKLIADQRDTDYYLPLAEIAMGPDADWSSPPAPTIFPDLPINCDAEDEETYEPNNSVDQAGSISGDTSFDGGICDTQADFYHIEIEGGWTAHLDMDGGTGDKDLDIYVWDVDAQRPARDETGSAIGSDGTTNSEEFSYQGPAYVMVYGYDGATATYTLTITAD